MHFVYVDDSGDRTIGVFSALAIPDDQWNAAFQAIRSYRHALAKSDGIYVHKEFHAWKFVSGRGRIANRFVGIPRRCEIFHETLSLISTLPGASLFNATFAPGNDERAFERLLNRIQKNMEVNGSRALLICDEGKETRYTKIRRRMAVHNPIPSMHGRWAETGRATKQIVIDRIIEDLVFKDSRKSFLIQAVDFCAYALCRREHQVPSKSALGLHTAFGLLAPILVTEANRKDPEGIIRA